MSFVNFETSITEEAFFRRFAYKQMLTFGIKFLDDAMIGISPTDLVLLGAGSGTGKTQFCTNLALANLAIGKKVHYFALEADRFEIQRRIKYQLLSHKYFAETPITRPRLEGGLIFKKWLYGYYGTELEEYENAAVSESKINFSNLNLFTKSDDFNITTLVEKITMNCRDSDLIIVDHVHYFDFEDQNENTALKDIAKMARTLALENEKPIVLVGHMRKKDKFNKDFAPSMEEFHGSSDLFKIATKVLTFASGKVEEMSGDCETFFRICKDRTDGSVTKYMGRIFFSPRKANYDAEYTIGWDSQTRERDKEFEPLTNNAYPKWARRNNDGASGGLRSIPNFAPRSPPVASQ